MPSGPLEPLPGFNGRRRRGNRCNGRGRGSPVYWKVPLEMAIYTLEIPKESDLHKKLIRKIESRIKLGEQEQQKRHETWRKAENSTLAFIPENEADTVRRLARENLGEMRYTTIQIPY